MCDANESKNVVFKRPLSRPIIRRKLTKPKRKPYFAQFMKNQAKSDKARFSAQNNKTYVPEGSKNQAIESDVNEISSKYPAVSKLKSVKSSLSASENSDERRLSKQNESKTSDEGDKGISQTKKSHTPKKLTSVEEDVEKGLNLKVYTSLFPFLRETISLKSFKSFWRANNSKLRTKIESIPQRPPPIKSITTPNDTTRYHVEQYFSKPEKKKKTKDNSDDDDDSEEDEEFLRRLRGLPPQPEKDEKDSLQKKIDMVRDLTAEERRKQKRKWKRRMREEALFVGGNKILFERHLAELRDYEHQGFCRKLRHDLYGPQVTEKQRIKEIVEALDKARLSNTKIFYPNRKVVKNSKASKPKVSNSKSTVQNPINIYNSPTQNDVTTIVVNRNEPVLVHVEFPGLVNDVNAALQCFGGENKLFETLGDAKRRLEIKLRPWDPSCKASYGDGQTTCGILIKIRRRLLPEPPRSNHPENPPLIGLNNSKSFSNFSDICAMGKKIHQQKLVEENGKHIQNNEKDQNVSKIEGLLRQERNWNPGHLKPYVASSGALVTKEYLTSKDTILSEEKDKIKNMNRVKRNKEHEDKYSYLNLPDFKVFKPPESQLEVEVQGLVTRHYKFMTSLCDVQFQPFKMFEGRQLCTAGKITDVFINPDGRWPYYSELVHLGKRIPEFIPPISFSRVYKFFKEFTMFENRKFSTDVASDTDTDSNPEDESEEENATSVIGQRSGRPKRLVHTHLFDFKKTDADLKPNVIQVPIKPYDRAIIDIRRKGLKNHRDVVAKLFEERPIWTKFALEHATKFDSHTLKYILPGVAYFTITSPWRSAWVRLSYDPRKDKQAYAYQMMDYRVPFVYRGYLGLSASSPINSFSYRAGTVPPKGQIFYQLCEINIPEVEELVINLGEKISQENDLQYDPKWGWVPAETLEYVRYNITRHIELHLYLLGKIPKVYSPALDLHPGEVFPRDKIRFWHNTQNKRIRRKKPTRRSDIQKHPTGVPHAKIKGKKEDADDVLEGLPQPIYKQTDDILPSVSMRNPRHFIDGPANNKYNPLEEDKHLFGDSRNVWSSKNDREVSEPLRITATTKKS